MSDEGAAAQTWGHLVGRLALVAAVVSIACLPPLAARTVSDPSPWLHLKVGAFLNEGGRFNLPDPWAPFADHAYVPTQWLPSMVTAWLYDHFGLGVVVWERAAGIGLLALSLFLWGRSIARPWVAVVVTAVAMFAAWPGLTERPQLAGFVLLVPVLAAWWRTAEDLRPRWHLVPLTWLAAATHGVWATGLALGGLVVVCLVLERRASPQVAARLVALLVACVGAAAVTPVGPRLLLTPFTVGSLGRQFVAEWLPSSVRSPGVLAALALLAVAWGCRLRSGSRPPLWQFALLLASFVLTLSMQRTVPVAALVAVPLATAAMETALPRHQPVAGDTRRFTGAILAAAATGLLLAIPVSAARSHSVDGVPTTLIPALRALPEGTRIVSQGDLTGWLLWETPQVRPVEDIRIEAYSSEHVRRYITTMAAEPGWAEFVAGTGAIAALLTTDSPLTAALHEDAGWRVVGEGDGYVLLEAQ